MSIALVVSGVFVSFCGGFMYRLSPVMPFIGVMVGSLLIYTGLGGW